MYVACPELLEQPRIIEVREIIDGIIEIEIVVIHSIHEISYVIDAGHRETAFEHVGMLEQGIGGMVRAERSAHGGDGHLRAAIVPDKRNDFFSQIGVKHGLHVAAMKRMRTLVVKSVMIG